MDAAAPCLLPRFKPNTCACCVSIAAGAHSYILGHTCTHAHIHTLHHSCGLFCVAALPDTNTLIIFLSRVNSNMAKRGSWETQWALLVKSCVHTHTHTHTHTNTQHINQTHARSRAHAGVKGEIKLQSLITCFEASLVAVLCVVCVTVLVLVLVLVAGEVGRRS